MWEYKTCDGETPLTLAAKAGLVKNVRTLLEKGVWSNTTNNKGETPLLIGNFFHSMNHANMVCRVFSILNCCVRFLQTKS